MNIQGEIEINGNEILINGAPITVVENGISISTVSKELRSVHIKLLPKKITIANDAP